MMFPRSFIFSNYEFKDSVAVGPGHIAVGPSTKITNFSAEPATDRMPTLTLIGYLIDLSSIEKTEAEVLAELAGCYHDKENFHDRLRFINGRFSLIAHHDGNWRVYHDAAATRTVFYSAGSQFYLSSHAQFIGDMLNLPMEDEVFKNYQFGYPGLRSRHAGVFLLPANFNLDPLNGQLERYWPHRERVEQSFEAAYETFSSFVSRACDGLLLREKPIVSLTAGLDSRTSFAAFKDAPGVEYFSYLESVSLSEPEIIIAKKICDIYNRSHTTVLIENLESSTETLKITDYSHVKYLSEAYLKYFGDKDLIHVRSNLCEIGRYFWQQKTGSGETKIVEPCDFIRRRHGMHAMSREAKDVANTEFFRMFDILGYNPTSQLTYMGYDTFDLFYWEHRMTTWHGPLLLGSDLAFDTFILYNSRVLLEAMLSVSNEDRRDSTLQKEFIMRNAEEVAGFPYNLHKTTGISRLRTMIKRQLLERLRGVGLLR